MTLNATLHALTGISQVGYPGYHGIMYTRANVFGDALQVLYQMSVPKNAAAARIVKEVLLICNCDNDVDVASVFFFW